MHTSEHTYAMPRCQRERVHRVACYLALHLSYRHTRRVYARLVGPPIRRRPGAARHAAAPQWAGTASGWSASCAHGSAAHPDHSYCADLHPQLPAPQLAARSHHPPRRRVLHPHDPPAGAWVTKSHTPRRRRRRGGWSPQCCTSSRRRTWPCRPDRVSAHVCNLCVSSHGQGRRPG